LLAAIAAEPCDVVKVACKANAVTDSLRVLDALRASTARKPTIALAMGEAGLITRVLARKYGAFLTSVVQFLIILTAIYFFVVRPMSGMMKRLGLVKEPPAVRDCPACLQSIPAAASKCMYCTIDVEPVQPSA
jgi:large-conductance mechanosensitive channel